PGEHGPARAEKHQHGPSSEAEIDLFVVAVVRRIRQVESGKDVEYHDAGQVDDQWSPLTGASENDGCCRCEREHIGIMLNDTTCLMPEPLRREQSEWREGDEALREAELRGFVHAHAVPAHHREED